MVFIHTYAHTDTHYVCVYISCIYTYIYVRIYICIISAEEKYFGHGFVVNQKPPALKKGIRSMKEKEAKVRRSSKAEREN